MTLTRALSGVHKQSTLNGYQKTDVFLCQTRAATIIIIISFALSHPYKLSILHLLMVSCAHLWQFTMAIFSENSLMAFSFWIADSIVARIITKLGCCMMLSLLFSQKKLTLIFRRYTGIQVYENGTNCVRNNSMVRFWC